MRAGFWMGLLALSSGCGEWPRYAHPQESAPSEPASEPPRVLWAATDGESEPNDWPDEITTGATVLRLGEGVALSGALSGVGYAGGAPAERGSGSCEHAPARRYPLSEGEYIGDVDSILIEVEQAGTLCGRVRMATPLAFDMLLLPLDDCALPGPAASVGAEIVGLDRGGDSASWATPVEAGTYAVQLAGWDPVDPDLEVEWDLEVALVSTLCPESGP